MMIYSKKRNSSIFQSLVPTKLYQLFVLITFLLILIPFMLRQRILQFSDDEEDDDNLDDVRAYESQLDLFDEFSNSLSVPNLKIRVQEMLRIKASVINELKMLEAKDKRLQKEIFEYHLKIDKLKEEIAKNKEELAKLKTSVHQAELSHLEAIQNNTPLLAAPIPLLSDQLPQINKYASVDAGCIRMRQCFDHSRCSITSEFPVYIYDLAEQFPEYPVSDYVKALIVRIRKVDNIRITDVPENACVYLVIIDEESKISDDDFSMLSYWGGDGRNHIIANLAKDRAEGRFVEPSKGIGRAIIAQSTWKSNPRFGHDIVLPAPIGQIDGDTWQEMPYMLPARRKYLLSFNAAVLNESSQNEAISNVEDISKHLTHVVSDNFSINFHCDESTRYKTDGGWMLCHSEKKRRILLKESTFSLVPAPCDVNFVSTFTFQQMISEALKNGAIPLVLGADRVELPFTEILDWNKAAILTADARITECHWLIRSVSDNDILAMRRQGRQLYERYFSSARAIVQTFLALIRNRLGIPPAAVVDAPSPSIFPKNFKPLTMETVIPNDEPEENLGPIEPPYNSPKFLRNTTILKTQAYEMWNDWGDPFHLYPYTPFDPLLPSDAKFIGSGYKFRLINFGAGGAGKEFSESLGGNSPKEQFTMVILTYERDQVLMSSLNRLRDLPYLNKVVVIWNSPRAPLQDLRWPDIGVPIHVVAGRKNSLNNRFLPYQVIETEAVLSIDDDAHLRHDEIIFGFRVWREKRDQVVGFPGRYHALDLNNGGWLYNSNYSCELSMVLTGAAFVHKYYLYMYSYWMPQAIRDMVDEYTNCEDIAMNFLVSHITKKPPVKVTSRWTFRCPGCTVSLTEDETHFNERHKCINFFAKVFGYTPLLNTQFRADSILFKTRIPRDKQKCFKFL